MRLRYAGVILLATCALAGCTTMSQPGALPAAPATPSSQSAMGSVAHAVANSPQATADPCVPPLPPIGQTRAAGSAPAGVYLAESNGCPGEQVALEAIDPATGAGRAGMTLPSFPAPGTISPDGRTMMAWDASTPALVDLTGRRPERPVTDTPRPVVLGPTAWSPDSSFAIMEDDHALWRLDVSTGHIRQIAEISTFSSIPPLMSPDGRTLYALTQQARSAWPPVTGDPFVAAIDTATGATMATRSFPGLRYGPQWGATVHDGYSSVYSPALAIAPDGGRLYVVAADSDSVTVLDASTLAIVKTASFARRPSLPQRFLSALAGALATPAEAKGGASTTRRATVSPDGSLLYLTGVADGGATTPLATRQPLGLTVLDTTTLHVRYHDSAIDHVELVGGGARLLATGWSEGTQLQRGSASTRVVDQALGAELLDARTLTVDARLTPDAVYTQVALSADGRYAALLSDATEPGAATVGQLCADPCWQLTTIDLQQGRVAAQIGLFGRSATLLAPRATWLGD